MFTLLDLTGATPSKERSSRVNPLPRKAGDCVRERPPLVRHPLGSACGALFTLLDLTSATPSKERSSRVNPLPRKAEDSVERASAARKAPPRLGLRHSPVPRKAGDSVKESVRRSVEPPARAAEGETA